MKSIALAASAAVALTVLVPSVAQAQNHARVYYENTAARGFTGPLGGRTRGEGGIVTDGDGNGAAGARGCTSGPNGGAGCSRGGVVFDDDGNVHGQRGGAYVGPNGNSAASYGSFDRDEDGDLKGQRNSEVHVGDRTYSAETTFNSDDGFDRDVHCSGSGC